MNRKSTKLFVSFMIAFLCMLVHTPMLVKAATDWDIAETKDLNLIVLKIEGQNKMEISGVSGKLEKDIVMPCQWDISYVYYDVVSIKAEAIKDQSEIETVIVRRGIQEIGDRAFMNCKNLSAVAIPYTLTTIGNQAFADCPNLKTVYIPPTVTSIGTNAFGYNTSTGKCAEDLVIQGIEGSYAEEYARLNGFQFKNPFQCESIGEDTLRLTQVDAFVSDIRLPAQLYGKKVTELGAELFANRVQLRHVIVPYGITKICDRAFYGCTNLKMAFLPHKLEEIGEDAFTNSGIYIFDIPFTVTRLGKHAFGYKLTGGESGKYETVKNFIPITTPGTVGKQYIVENHLNSYRDYSTFTYEANADHTLKLKEIYTYNLEIGIPEQIDGSKVSSIVWEFGISQRRNMLSEGDVRKVVEIPALAEVEAHTGLLLPEGEITLPVMDRIHTGAFDARYCTAITIPAGIGQLGDGYVGPAEVSYGVFDGSPVKEIILEKGNTKIDELAFWSTTGLENIIIPDTVTTIGKYALGDCPNLKSVCIPESVSSIGEKALGWRAGDPGILDTLEVKVSEFTIIGKKGTAAETYAMNNGFIFKELYEYENLTDGTVRITAYNGNEKEVSVPSVLGGKSVSAIGNDAFMGKKFIEKVNIPFGVTSIGNNAFLGCTGMKGIELPATLQTLGDRCFGNCGKLEKIVIPACVTAIGNAAFDGCDSLKLISVDEQNASFISRGGVLFTRDMTRLMKCPSGIETESYTIPLTVTRVDTGAFYGCRKLHCIVSFENVTSFGDYSIGYYYDEKTDTVARDKSVILRGVGGSEAEKYAKNNGIEFKNVYDYTKLEDGTVQITKCFIELDQIRIPASIDGLKVTSIKADAFSGNTWIEKVVIPDGIVTVESGAFRDCSYLRSVELGKDVAALDAVGVFGGCGSLTDIRVSEKNVEYAADGGNLYNKEKTEILMHVAKESRIVIPAGITTIGRNAFAGNSNLTEVVFPETLIQIRQAAFYNCRNLRTVKIPFSVQAIGVRALGFYNTPDSVVHKTESFLIRGFTNTESEKYAIDNGFAFEGGLPGGTFGDCSWSFDQSTGTLTISGEGKLGDNNSFSATGEPWGVLKSSITKLVIGNNVTSIGTGAFCYLDKLKEVVIGKSVETIDEFAFSNCTLLERITIPDNVTVIGSRAFANCGLKEVVIGAGVRKIGDKAFSGCQDLIRVEIPAGVSQIGDMAFGYKADGSTVAGFKIKGEAGSTAETYARENRFTFLKKGSQEDLTGQPVRFLAESSLKDPKVKIIVQDQVGGYHTIELKPTGAVYEGMKEFSGNIPSDIEPAMVQIQTYDGSVMKSSLTLNREQYLGLKDQIITPDGKAYSGKDAGKKANPCTIKVKKKTLKAFALKKKATKIKAIAVKKAKGKVTYKIIKTGTDKKIRKLVSIDKKGTITLKKWKKAKKGTYKIRVQITVKGNKTYLDKVVAETVTLKVK